MPRKLFAFTLLWLGSSLYGQFDPQNAEVISYFPHLADGGSAAQRWTTALTFVNPHGTLSLNGRAAFFHDDGTPLALDFGGGSSSTLNFSLSPQGSVTYTSTAASSQIVTGWAIVATTLPVEGVIQFRYSANGVPQQGVASQSTAASALFRSPATTVTGIAIANVSSAAVPFKISAIDSTGTVLNAFTKTMPPLAHDSYTLGALFTGLPASFRGTVVVETLNPATYLAVWTVGGDGGVLASYPPSGRAWPISQNERIYKVWQKVLNVAAQSYPQIASNPPTLFIDANTTTINSFADLKANQVHIFLNLAELISDSESELGFVVAHEMGHIIQARIGGLVFLPNAEFDADVYGLVLGLESGYDPYGAAGALAKLSMASGDAGLVSQQFDNISGDPHGSFDNRIALIFGEMQLACAQPSARSFCANYKLNVHPHLPPGTPLDGKVK
jgi:hypothetical protein